MRVPALEQDPRLQARHAAGRVESPAKPETAFEQQQRKLGKVGDLDGAIGTKRRRGVASSQQLHRSQRKTAEVPFVQRDGMQQVLAEMDFPAFEHRQYLAACTLGDLHLDPGISLRIPKQKLRQHTFEDRKSTRLNSSHPSISYAVF